MIALTLDEVVAMVVFLVQARREGQPLWRTFWQGGTLTGAAGVGQPPPPGRRQPRGAGLGVTLPWNLLASVALGLWLMAAPAVLGFAGSAAHSNHLGGALVVTVAVMALAEVGRPLRFLNMLFGAWFIVAPWLLSGTTTAAALSSVLVGVALILLSIRRGPVRESYGGWNRYIV